MYIHLISKNLIFIFFLVLIGCGNQKENMSPLPTDELRMEIDTKYVSEICKMVKVKIMLAEDVEQADLNNFQLKVELLKDTKGNQVTKSSTSKLQYKNAAKKKEITKCVQAPLTHFTSHQKLGIEDENLIISFKLINIERSSDTSVQIELLANDMHVIQKHIVSCNTMNIDNSSLVILSNSVAEARTKEICTAVKSSPSFFYKWKGIGNKLKQGASTTFSRNPKIRQTDKVERPTPFKAGYISQSLKGKEKVEENEREEEILKRDKIAVGYSMLQLKELAIRANNNDADAQEAIVRECFKKGSGTLLRTLVNPFNWEGIREKIQEDQRYVFLLLCFSSEFQVNSRLTQEHVLLFEEIFENIQAKSKTGNPLAQNNLGFMYQIGLGVPKDYKQALKWCTKAARKGFAIAEFNLGYMYFMGLGVKKDNKQAVAWYKKAAKQDHPAAQVHLSAMYFKGLGVKKDNKQAMVWCRKAAEQGYMIAQFNLGFMYCMAKDKEEGIAWCRKAAKQEYAIAQLTLGHMCEIGLVGKGNKQNEKAVKWYMQAATQGEPHAQTKLGQMYYIGKGVVQDNNQSLVWLKKAAKQGYAIAQGILGYMYYKGLVVDKDISKTIFWFMQSKYKMKLLDILTLAHCLTNIPTTTSEVNLLPKEEQNNDFQQIERLERELLVMWQYKLIREKYNKEYNMDDISADISPKNAYEQLEDLISKFVRWRHHILVSKTWIMVSCIRFKKEEDKIAIEKLESTKGITPWVKEYMIDGKTYMSFGKENIRIVNDLSNKQSYTEVKDTLSKLITSYKYIYENAIKNGDNQLADVVNSKLREVPEELQLFEEYYSLLSQEILKSVKVCNKKFQNKHDYLFNRSIYFKDLDYDKEIRYYFKAFS